MTFEEAVAYIDETPKFTQKHSLAHTKECLRRLGDPQNSFRVIHVAGTNGKGSTCAFLASVLKEAGFRTGLFTSPHLVDIRERFQINEENISVSRFMWAFDQVKSLSDQLTEEGSGHPTYFEMIFLMGMLIFKEEKADYVVLETGLGGRLDATTAIEDPLACVITSISLDHMQYLGNTVAEIAAEKAGIIVPGVPVIYDANDPAAAAVIAAKAEEMGSPAWPVRKEESCILRMSQDGIDFTLTDKLLYQTELFHQAEFHIPFIAAYQVMNASLSLTTLEVLKRFSEDPSFRSITSDQIRQGLLKTRWQGRMETVLPGVIVDGAHNEDGVEKFVETAEHFQHESSLLLLFSAVDDKDYPGMIETIISRIHFRRIFTTQVGGYRQVPAEKLADIFREKGCTNVSALEDPLEAFRMAYQEKQDKEMLFCVGSLYLVGNIKDLINREYTERI